MLACEASGPRRRGWAVAVGRKVATPRVASQGADVAPVGALARPRWSPRSTRVALAGLGLVLAAVVGVVVWREATAPARAPAIARASAPARPAFTPAEEAYIRALWPIFVDPGFRCRSR